MFVAPWKPPQRQHLAAVGMSRPMQPVEQASGAEGLKSHGPCSLRQSGRNGRGRSVLHISCSSAPVVGHLVPGNGPGTRCRVRVAAWPLAGVDMFALAEFRQRFLSPFSSGPSRPVTHGPSCIHSPGAPPAPGFWPASATASWLPLESPLPWQRQYYSLPPRLNWHDPPFSRLSNSVNHRLPRKAYAWPVGKPLAKICVNLLDFKTLHLHSIDTCG